jgi:hypothetical protein
MNHTAPAPSEEQADALLRSIRFTPPARATVWTPGRSRSRRWFTRPVLIAASLALLGAGVVAAQGGLLPIFRTPLVEDCVPDRCGPNYSVAAEATNEDDSVRAVNLIVASGTDRAALEDIAEGFRSRHDASRVIVSFFAEGAGQEASEFGLVPSGLDDPFTLPDKEASWLGTVDFVPDRAASEHWAGQ